MTLYPDQDSSQTCLCRGTVVRTQRYIRSPSIDITLILDLIEDLTSSFQRSSRGGCGCLQLSEYVQMLLVTTDSLLDILDATWKKAFLGTDTNIRAPVKAQVILSPVGSNEKKLVFPIITGFQNIAMVDRFVLDDVERKLVLQEILRGYLVSINHIVRDLHDQIMHPGQSNSWHPEDKKRMNVQSTTLLERTYSALARYGGSPN